MLSIRQMQGLKIKLLLYVAVIMTIVMFLCSTWMFYSAEIAAKEDLFEKGTDTLHMQAEALAGPLWDLNIDNIKIGLKANELNPAFRYAKVMDKERNVLAEIGDNKIKETDLVFKSRIYHEGEGKHSEIGQLTIVLSMDHALTKARNDFFYDISLFLLLLLATMITIYSVMMRLVISPIKEMTNALGEMEDGDFSAKLPVYNQDEIGVLSDAFNQMTEKLKNTHIKLQSNANELRLANEDLRNAKLLAVNANQAKSRFLASMSHELRTPLNAIIGYSEILTEEIEEMSPAEAVADLDRIITSGKHLLNLINDILDLSKIESGKLEINPENFDLNHTLHDVGKIATPLIARGNNKFEIEIDENIGVIYSDEHKIRQNLLNLLSNASKFTHDGKIVLQAKLNLINDVSYVDLSVTDTGIGLSSEQMVKIFDPFVQADASTTRKYGGTGLGLSITQKTCELLGGNVFVSSKIGKGSIFTLHIPTQYVANDTNGSKDIAS